MPVWRDIIEKWEGLATSVAADAHIRAQAKAAHTPEGLLDVLARRSEGGKGPALADLKRALDLVLTVEPDVYWLYRAVQVRPGDLSGFQKYHVLLLQGIGALGRFLQIRPYGGRLRRMWGHLTRPFFKRAIQPPAGDVRALNRSQRTALGRRLKGLGEESWRQFIDWEDQHHGPRVYDDNLHGRARERGFLRKGLLSLDLLADFAGERINADLVARLLREIKGNYRAGMDNFDNSPRDLWRFRRLMDEEALREIPKENLRLFPHQRWQAVAFRYAYGPTVGDFLKAHPVCEKFVQTADTPDTPITRAWLDRTFIHFEVCWFDKPYNGPMIQDAIDEFFAGFYARMDGLETEKAGADAKERAKIEAAQIREIAWFYRWFEHLRPYYDANIRLVDFLTDKLLVDYGFCPTILAHRLDACFHTTPDWAANIEDGMRRWLMIRLLTKTGLLETALGFQDIQSLRR